jgi:uncharacterized protein YaiI (UPF0178 family)
VSTIWVDADACPVVVREVLYRAAQRTGVALVLVANQAVRVPPGVRMLQVSQGFDVADNEIVNRCGADDLVITSDIPLAAEVIAKGASALSPRGQRFTAENIGPKLNMRDFLETMRGSGLHSGGPPALSLNDRQAFANQLDRWLAKRHA